MKKYLILTVDTEEEFNWRRMPFLQSGASVKNIRELCRIQKAFADMNAKVSYFIDFPVLKDRVARDILKEFHQQYGAELGTHLHPWCTPPFEEEVNSKNTMVNMLPANLVRSKMEMLTELFYESFGFRPLSYRAGRFGFDAVSAKIIGELGYKIDSSITPFQDWSKSYGPNFFFAPLRPYIIDGENILCEDKKGAVWEMPISAGFNRVPFKFWRKVYWYAKQGKLRNLKLVGALDRTNLLKRISLSPEFQSVEEMKSLVRNLWREKVDVFNMIFHSSSLTPGGNSIVRTFEQASAFEKRVMDIASWIMRECGAASIRLSDYLSIQKTMDPVSSEVDGLRCRRAN